MGWTMRKRRRFQSNVLQQLELYVNKQKLANDPNPNFTTVKYDGLPQTMYLRLQETEDVDRKVHPRNKLSSDDGGPFRSKTLEVSFKHIPYHLNIGPYFDGPYLRYDDIAGIAAYRNVLTDPYLTGNSSAISSLWNSFGYPNDTVSFGPKAFSRLNPTITDVPNIGESLSEILRLNLPSIPKFLKTKHWAKRKQGKMYGQEYLNVSFGWLPLLADIKKMLDLYKRMSAIVAQLERDNGQKVRRSGRLSYSKVSSQILEDSFPNRTHPVMNGSIGLTYEPAPPGRLPKIVRTVEDKVWFSGRGSYILPIDLNIAPSNSDIDNLISLTVAAVSPSTLWDIMPWSWFIDYFTNFGDIVKRALGQGIGTYTADYCYVMRQRSQTDVYSTFNDIRGYFEDHLGVRHYPQSDTNPYVTVKTVTKERIAASPFGFALTSGDLSGRQIAILTALGLSRQNLL